MFEIDKSDSNPFAYANPVTILVAGFFCVEIHADFS